MQQEASASCDAGGDRETSASHPLPPLLHRPSFSLELYNRFSQNAMNTILSDDESITQTNDMDIDADVDADSLAGIPRARDKDNSTGEPNPLGKREEVRNERKRVGGDGVPSDGNAAKKVSASKEPDITASAYDATAKSVSSTGPSSMYSTNTVYKYSNNRPPYTLQVQSMDDYGFHINASITYK